jgi:putative ABC transport system permease protein
MLVMLGCVLGTALIVGSGSVSDSYTGSIRERAFDRLGPIDATITYENATNWAEANARLAAGPIDGVRTTAATATLEVPITAASSAIPAPRAKLIEADYPRARDLTQSAGAAAGTGPTLGTAWVGTSMARRLNLHVGDVLTIHTKVPNQHLTVARVVNSPLVTFVDGTVRSSDNLLVPPGTITKLQQQDPQVLVPTWLTLVEGTGPHRREVPPPREVNALQDQLDRVVSPFSGRVEMTRARSLATANQVGEYSAQFLVTIGAFGVIAGIMLLINVLLMLAEERLAELGTMRAVGMPREPLIASFALEGAMYALVGSALGGLAGLGLGRFMVLFASNATTATAGVTKGLQIHFFAQTSTVISGIAAGFFASTLVVIATSYRVSRLDVIRSLRGLPAPPGTYGSAAAPLLVAGIVGGATVGFIGYYGHSAFPLLLGPVLAFAFFGVLVARHRGYVVGITFATVPIMVWATVFVIVNTDPRAPQNGAVLSGVVMVACGVLFVNAQQAALAGFVRRFGRGRSAIPGRLGLANPLAHRVRTLLTIGPFALVVFTLTYAEGLSNLISADVARIGPELGGQYQVYASSSPAHPFAFSSLDSPDVAAVAPTRTVLGSFTPNATASQRLWPVSAFDNRLYKVEPPVLIARNSRFKSDRETYAAVAADPDLIIVPATFLYGEAQSLGNAKDDPPGPPQPGFTYTMFDPASGAARDVTVAGVTHSDVTGFGSFYGLKGAQALFGSRLIETSAFISTRGDPHAFVRQLSQAGVDAGVQADVIQDAADDYFSFVNDLINLYRSDLGIGIVVGIAGIAVVLVRSVRDRRRQIGTLRAMGVDAKQMGASFLIEGAFVALQGLAIGMGLGIVNVMTITKSDAIVGILGYEPSIPRPAPTLLVIALLLLVASLAASVGPARSASKIPPAVALRLVD